MKNLSCLRLALLYAGCFLGAGYVSGQELLQFFGVFGVMGYWGLLLTMLLLFLLGVLLFRLCRLTGLTAADRVVVPWESPLLRGAFSGLESLMMFAVSSVMSAGVGALAEQLFSLPHFWGSLLFSLLLLLGALTGLQGIVSVFSVSVPLLVLVTAVFGIVAAARGGLSPAPAAHSGALLGGWFISALNFTCYNLFGAIVILTPFGPYLKNRRTVRLGVGLGVAALLVIAASVLVSLSCWPAAADAELPMLFAASTFGRAPALLYALLLAAAMYGTALSTTVGLLHMFTEKFACCRRRRYFLSMALCALMFLASLCGFGDLIGTLYPLFGYASAVFLLMLPLHLWKLRRAGIGEKAPAVPGERIPAAREDAGISL